MFRAMASPEVIIVGSGIIGCATAYALARAGIPVRVLERDRPGAHASAAAAGMLAPLAESDGHGPLFELGVAALSAFPDTARELADRTGIDVSWVQRGLVRVFRKDAAPTLSAPTLAEGKARPGAHPGRLEVEFWDAVELRGHLPGLTADVQSARYSPSEGVVDPIRLTRAYRVAAEGCGATFESGIEVIGPERRGDRVLGVRTRDGVRPAGHVVWCAGAWSGSLETPSGRLPVEPVKGQMVALDSDTLRSGPLIWGDEIYLVPRSDGLVRIGATVEHVGFDVEVRVGGVLALLRSAVEIWPTLAQARLGATWAGLRPTTPDGLPLVGACPGMQRISLATGHGRHGVLLAGPTSERIRDVVLGRDTAEAELPWSALDPLRFASPPAARRRMPVAPASTGDSLG